MWEIIKEILFAISTLVLFFFGVVLYVLVFGKFKPKKEQS